MTRKDFVLIANVLRDHRVSGSPTPDDLALLDNIARHFASELQGTNAAFDTARFLTACGVKP